MWNGIALYTVITTLWPPNKPKEEGGASESKVGSSSSNGGKESDTQTGWSWFFRPNVCKLIWPVLSVHACTNRFRFPQTRAMTASSRRIPCACPSTRWIPDCDSRLTTADGPWTFTRLTRSSARAKRCSTSRTDGATRPRPATLGSLCGCEWER